MKNLIKVVGIIALLITVMTFAKSVDVECNLSLNDITNLKKYLTDEEISSLSCQTLESIKNDTNIKMSQKKYIEVLVENDVESYTYLKEVDSFEDGNNNVYLPQASYTHSTTYKNFYVSAVNSYSANGQVKYITVDSTLSWKKMPKVRSWDAFGLLVNSGGLGFAPAASTFYLRETTDGGTTVDKNYNFVIDSNNKGYGLVFAISDTATNRLSADLYTRGTAAGSPSRITISYQHSQKNISYSEAIDFGFSSSGYGGIFNYRNTNAKNAYDQMAGIYFDLTW